MISNFLAGFRLLRVVDLKGEPLEFFPDELLNLFHVRYLGMRRTKSKKLPDSIGKLQNLETLDLKYTDVSEIPAGVLKLKKIRYVLILRYDLEQFSPLGFLKGFMPIAGISSLKSLQKLSFIEVDEGNKIIEELGKLTQLRKLSIIQLRKEDGNDICSSIEKMSILHSLSVSSRKEDEFLDLESLSVCPPLLQRLVMRGSLAKLPSWISSLRHLVKIRLRWAFLSDSPLEALQDLPNLVELELFHAFVGVLLCFEVGFPKLNLLNLKSLTGLKKVEFKKGAVLQLEKLYIVRCVELQNVPLGIEHLTNLKDLRFYDLSEELMKRVQCEDEEDRQRINHILEIHAFFWKDRWEYLDITRTVHKLVAGDFQIPINKNNYVLHFQHHRRCYDQR